MSAALVSTSARALDVPEVAQLRQLRASLARGGMPRRRSAEDQARLAAFRTVDELLQVLDEYRRRLESGARCRLVEHEHGREPGRLLLELRIEQDP